MAEILTSASLLPFEEVGGIDCAGLWMGNYQETMLA